MPVNSPCTWNMTSAQLVSPTTSQLAAINAIQAMITSSTYWTVSNTGTTTAGYKYVEARPTNTSSIYKDYRVLFVERINTTTNKAIMGSLVYSATNIMCTFAPDGGSSWCTFTPANIETANHVYSGTRYKYVTGTSWSWLTIQSPYTAFWMYECDGQMWISHRSAATSYYIWSFGASYISPRATHVDYNEAGTEVGIPGMYQKTAAFSSATSMATGLFPANSFLSFWYNSSGTTKTMSYSSSPFGSADSTPGTNQAPAFYNTTSATAIFKPITLTTNTGTAADSSNLLCRGTFWSANMATRTTVKDAAGTTTLGYSWYPDDAALASSNNDLMFINTP